VWWVGGGGFLGGGVFWERVWKNTKISLARLKNKCEEGTKVLEGDRKKEKKKNSTYFFHFRKKKGGKEKKERGPIFPSPVLKRKNRRKKQKEKKREGEWNSP